MSSLNSGANPTASEQLEWSDVDYTFRKFLDQFTLPQLAKVQDGFCSKDETCSLSAGQILTVRTIRTTEIVLARDQRDEKLHIPLYCSQMVELCSPKVPEFPATKEHLRRHKYVRVLRDPHQRLPGPKNTAHQGMKLEVVRFQGGTRKGVVFKKEDGDFVYMPFDLTVMFQPLVDDREYSLEDLSARKLPVYFKFIDTPETTTGYVFSSSLGVLKFEKAYRDTSVIYSIKHKGVERVFACPKDMDITVRVPQGAIEKDKDYLNLCQSFQDGLNLRMIAHLEAENIYEDPDDIREYKNFSLILPQQIPKNESKTGEAYRSGQSLRSPSADAGSLEGRPVQEAKPPAPDDGRPPIPSRRKIPLSTKPRKPKPKPVVSTAPLSSANEMEFEIPEDMQEMSVGEVSHFLKKFHLAEFVDVFEENQVDGKMLVSMDADEMRAIGMNAFQSKKLQRLTKGWRPKL